MLFSHILYRSQKKTGIYSNFPLSIARGGHQGQKTLIFGAVAVNPFDSAPFLMQYKKTELRSHAQNRPHGVSAITTVRWAHL